MKYNEYIPVHLPLIISIPHGGRLFPPEIPDKIDVNRPIKEGVEDPMTLVAWNDYHNFMQTAIKDVETNFSHGLLMTLMELFALYTRKSNNIQFADLLYGQTTSFGGRLQSHGYATVPSLIHKYPFKDTKYFHGGYCVQKYGSQYAGHEYVNNHLLLLFLDYQEFYELGIRKKRGTFILALSE
ncbi:38996_t:CDS:2 [Gigaspora margarita]|uniref:38996_t:CDS:1 n=1 Tax=Gigaspora margarita TaxID=4874 RepID=A0ABM8W3N6_GIGMA|nr:38996_t:CDS:2 [Gigaspora margarita]